MNLLTDTWRQLVRRKLWPVAVLLVGAMAAVPYLLAKSPAAPAAPVTTANAAIAAATPVDAEPVVALADDTKTSPKRRRVLGARKDPFEPAALPKVKKAKKAAAAQATPTPDATSTPAPADGGGSSGSAGTGGGDGGTITGPVATPVPTKTVPAGSVTVRFGKTDKGAEMKDKTLQRLMTLPSASSPIVVFMGLKDGGKVAEFMITGDQVTGEGDGRCDPQPDSCTTLTLRKGDTEFVTIKGTAGDAQYELDLTGIYASKTVVPIAVTAAK